MTRVSLDDDITNRQLENGAVYCGRFTPVACPGSRDDRRVAKEPFIWTAPTRDRHLDKELFEKLDKACSQLTGLDRYIPLVIFLMVETGLRIEELCTVKWEQVSLDKRRMEVLSRAGRKSMRPGQSSYRFGYACISKSSLPH